MKNLWTPWRLAHILDTVPRFTGCLFEPPGEEPFNKKHLLLYRDATGVVMLNRFPYANGHLLVAPRRHLADITELNTEENAALMQLLQHCARILRQQLHPDGLNIGLNLGAVAGAGITDHLHFHVVPRWAGDHNFITVVAEIRTIPQHIEDTFEQLLPNFQALLTDHD